MIKNLKLIKISARRKILRRNYHKKRVRYYNRQLKYWEGYRKRYCIMEFDTDVIHYHYLLKYEKAVKRINAKKKWHENKINKK